MLHRIKEGQCFSATITIANVALACIDGTIAAVSFSQLLRIHLRNKQLGWTRQKVFHLMIGCSNIGYLIYFTSTLVATCMGWSCWSHACAFILMACPQILFLAAFLLLLSFWVDLCHQTNDEDEEDEDDSSYEALLENTKDKSGQLHVNYHRKCCPLHALHVGSRQRFVILVVVLIFALMIVFSVLIWVGMGKNPINSSVIARVYLDLFATTILLLGGALSCYGLALFLKMRKVRTGTASSEMWKVAGLAAVCLVCFTLCALVALVTNIPVLYQWHSEHANGVYSLVLIVLYYFIGSSVPSGFVLWVMREMPPQLAVNRQTQPSLVNVVRDRPVVTYPKLWVAATSTQNQASRGSPI